jgi:ABC-type sulfate transport system permease component
MSPRYIRTRPERRDEVTAAMASGVLAIGVGLVTFYVVRLLLSREPLGDPRRLEGPDAPRTEE